MHRKTNSTAYQNGGTALLAEGEIGVVSEIDT
jgi:hypothetical protein